MSKAFAASLALLSASMRESSLRSGVARCSSGSWSGTISGASVHVGRAPGPARAAGALLKRSHVARVEQMQVEESLQQTAQDVFERLANAPAYGTSESPRPGAGL